MNRGVNEIMANIMLLTKEINDKTSYCTFLKYSGHCDNISITIARNKEDFNHRIILEEQYGISLEEDYLLKVESMLQGILSNGEIDHSILEKHPWDMAFCLK